MAAQLDSVDSSIIVIGEPEPPVPGDPAYPEPLPEPEPEPETPQEP